MKIKLRVFTDINRVNLGYNWRIIKKKITRQHALMKIDCNKKIQFVDNFRWNIL